MRTLRSRFLLLAAASAVIAAGPGAAVPFAAQASPPPLIIKVDAADPANQQPFPPQNRLYEYTDFFSRQVKVHRGDTVNFQSQPGSFHIVGLARDEAAARAAYPMIQLDTDDGPAPGSGLPKIVFGSGNFPVTGGSTSGGGQIDLDKGKGPPVCGVVQFQQEPCRFRGDEDVEIIGPTPGWDFAQQPATLDQLVVVDAPVGTYTYFDVNHPGARGRLIVEADDRPTSTQAQIDAASAAQLTWSRIQARTLETVLNNFPVVINRADGREFFVSVGAGTPDNRVSIDAMMPRRPVNARAGDIVTFVWADPKSFHTVGFAPSPWALPSPFGYDCGNGVYQNVPNVFNAPPPTPCLEPGATEPESIGDPGNAPSGTALSSPDAIVDSGLLVGSAYGVSPVRHTWSVRITAGTQPGTYTYFDTVRPWMMGVISVG